MELKKKLEVLKRIASALNKENVTWAVGASMLLYFKGIVSEFHDIDLMVTLEDVEKVKAILGELGEKQKQEPNSQYKTKCFLEYVIDEVDVDVMAGFVIVNNGQDYPISFDKDSILETIQLGEVSIPLQSVESWKSYYALMNRQSKVELIEAWLNESKEKQA